MIPNFTTGEFVTASELVEDGLSIFLLITIISITLLLLLILSVFCLKFKIRNKSFFTVFIHFVTCSKIALESKIELKNFTNKPSVSTQEEQKNLTDDFSKTVEDTSHKPIRFLDYQMMKIKSIDKRSIDKRIKDALQNTPATKKEIVIKVSENREDSGKEKDDINAKILAALKVQNLQKDIKSVILDDKPKKITEMLRNKSFIEKLKKQLKSKNDLLNSSPEVRSALKKIQDFADKERSKSRHKIKANSKRSDYENKKSKEQGEEKFQKFF